MLGETDHKFEAAKEVDSENHEDSHRSEFLQKKKSIEINEFKKGSLQHISDDEDEDENENAEEETIKSPDSQ